MLLNRIVPTKLSRALSPHRSPAVARRAALAATLAASQPAAALAAATAKLHYGGEGYPVSWQRERDQRRSLVPEMVSLPLLVPLSRPLRTLPLTYP